MTDKTDLNEQVKLHVGFMKAADNPVSDHYHLKEIKRLFIEQACAIGDDHKDRTGFIIYGTQQEAFNQGIEVMQQAIRDRLK